MSKVDPEQLGRLDRKSTILLQAARQRTETDEKSVAGQEDPGIDALRGSFGTVGSIIRARSARRLSQSSRRTSTPGIAAGSTAYDIEAAHAFPDRIVVQSPTAEREALAGMTRHQLYDAPVPRPASSALSPPSSPSAISKRPTINYLSNADLYTTNSDDDNDGSTLPLLSHISSEHAAHSAPPLINQRLPKRIDARDIFHSSSRAPTQLPTFPSPVDSTLSVGAAQSSRSNSSTSGKTDRGRSPRRNYPRGDEEDDRDESVGLWQPEEDDDIPPPGGGIRLVQPTSDHLASSRRSGHSISISVSMFMDQDDGVNDTTGPLARNVFPRLFNTRCVDNQTYNSKNLQESATRSTALVPAVPAAVRSTFPPTPFPLFPDPNVAAIVAHVLVIPVDRATRTVVSVDAPAAAANSRVPRNYPGTIAKSGPLKNVVLCKVRKVPPGKSLLTRRSTSCQGVQHPHEIPEWPIPLVSAIFLPPFLQLLLLLTPFEPLEVVFLEMLPPLAPPMVLVPLIVVVPPPTRCYR
ncbi:DUF803-domain-containing protein [Salix suchowensis]|nr:DUF803-domain-containing protein [Salix suchowensis]